MNRATLPQPAAAASASAAQLDVLIIAGNARSLIANRGNLIADMLAQGMTVAAAVPIRDYLPEVDALGIPIYPVRMARTGTNPLADLRYTFDLWRLIRRLRPRTVFPYTVKPVVYGALAARMGGGVRTCGMITGLGHAFTTESWRTRLIRRLLRPLYRHAFRYMDRVFFQNPDDEADFRAFGVIHDDSRLIRINGSGVDLERFAPRPLPSGPPMFLFIGRLLTEKGIREFVEAASELAPQWPGVRFVAVGPRDATLPHVVNGAELADWEAQGCVEFTGAVTDVRPWVEACSVLVLPSYREGTPRAVLEAMAMNRAVITTDAPGCRETIVHGESGLLVPPRDAASLAGAMAQLLAEPALIPQLAAMARQRAETKYDVRGVNAQIIAVLRPQEHGLCN